MSLAGEAHLVGSLNLADARTVFESVAEFAGDVVARIPDGETGERQNWIVAQISVLTQVAGLELIKRPRGPHDDWLPDEGLIWFRVRQGVDPRELSFPALGYRNAARGSYEIFSELKRDGMLRGDLRFQVSLPTPLGVVNAYIAPDYQAAVEPAFERAMRREVEGILADLPHHELAIQWDVAVEVTLAEGLFPVWFAPVVDGVLERLARIASWVPPDVSVGFHLCYGDAGGRHIIEPRDAGLLVTLANGISREVRRPVGWIHMPVPIERDDDAYFAPLQDLALPAHTKLYLGLLHKEDGLDGARRRIAAARRQLSGFGVATECGMARDAQPADIPGLLALHRQAAELLSSDSSVAVE